MTPARATEIARSLAQQRGWAWLGDISVSAHKKWFVFGPRRWHVLSNTGARGCNARILIDDATGEVVSAAYCPR